MVMISDYKKSSKFPLKDEVQVCLPVPSITRKSPDLKWESQRFVTKNGACGMKRNFRIPKYKYFANDFFTTSIDSRWRYVILWFSVVMVITWILFGVLWWVIAYAHGDLDISPYKRTSGEPCINNIVDMISAFMFSLETQYTTGYGTRTPTCACPEAIFLLCVQSLFGMVSQALMVGVIFAKLARPKARSSSIKFSKKAVICLRDGNLCLMIRMADMGKSHVVGCKVYGWFLRRRVTSEGEQLPIHPSKLKLSVDDGGSNFFLLWPVTIVHKIDRRSPLYNLSAFELFSSRFEIVICMVCTAETTGQQTEARFSYRPSDIIWGHRFHSTIHRESNGELAVDYAEFNRTYEVDTALCSAAQLDSFSNPGSPINQFKSFDFSSIDADLNENNPVM